MPSSPREEQSDEASSRRSAGGSPHRHKPTTKPLTALLLLTILLTATAASADEAAKRVKPTAGQLEWNARSVEASEKGDFDLAIKFLRASLDIGKLNVTYLNLGRTYQKAGKCFEAEAAYLSALEAPVADVQYPSPEDVGQLVEKFRTELRKTCPGKLVVFCEPQETNMTYNIDDEVVIECDGGVAVLTAGVHSVRGTLFDWVVREDVKIKPLETTSLTLRIEVTEDQIRARKLFSQGEGHLSQGRSSQARIAYSEAAKADPDWPKPRQRLAEVPAFQLDLPSALQAHKVWLEVAHKKDRPAIEAAIKRLEQTIQRNEEAKLRKLAEEEAKARARVRSKRLRGVGWLLGGAAAFGGAAALDTLPDSANNFEHDAMDFVPWPIYVAGAGAVIYGIFTLTEDDEALKNN